MKIVHKNVVTLHIYTSHTESDNVQLFFGWMPHPKTHGSMLHDRLKQNPTNKKTGELNLKLNYIFGMFISIIYLIYNIYIFSRNLIFGEKEIQSPLHICISIDSIEGWKIFEKKIHEIPKNKT